VPVGWNRRFGLQLIITNRILVLLLMAVSSFSVHAQNVVRDDTNAERLIMRARSLNGHQPTTIAPGNQAHDLNSRRGGPFAAHYQEAGCGGIAIGNVRPVIGDHRQHKTTVVINGNIHNSGNRCN
jgi:hypothetical protein